MNQGAQSLPVLKMSDLDDASLKAFRDLLRRIAGICRANPGVLQVAPINDLVELEAFIAKFRPLFAESTREMGNLQGVVTKALKRRRKEIRA
ncbi:hypothetical protein ABU614_21980 [Lysobacter firmicutimachus]|uniref:Uncharacterized protein n=1 Tax=Lysobacter firmicutimachus TaxID=1792846 RepID=A0AAU8MRU3_9GAMM